MKKLRLVALIILFGLLAANAHAQVDAIRITGNGVTGTKTYAAPFTINCSSGVNCSPDPSSALLTLTSTGSGMGCVLQGGTNLLLFDTSTTCNDITKWQTNGTTTITGLATSILDLSAAAQLKVPSAAACSPTVSALACYDTTNNKWVFGQNGSTVSFGLVGSCTNQAVISLSATVAPGCATITSSYVNNTIALTGTDINTSNQVTATHISGGTNTDLATFNATGNLINYGGVTCTNQVLASLSAAGAGGCHTIVSGDTSGTFPATAHNLLSATHGDTTAAAAVRGDGIFAIGATPTWQRLAHSTATGGYFKWNGTDIVASTGAAAGTGSCTNQVVTSENADAGPTCTTVTSAFTSGTFPASAHNLLSATHGDTTTHTVLRGDLIAGIGASPSWTAVAAGGTNTYPKWNASADVVPSTLPASGTGACPTSPQQYAKTLNADATPTCAQIAYADVSGTPTLFYQTVQNAAGTDQTQRGKVEFTGSGVASVADDGANNRTVVTLTAGTGCSPSGGTPNGVIYDTGSGNCDDIPKLTWNNGTSTLTGASGGHFDLSSFTDFKFKVGTNSTVTGTGINGQPLLANGDGTYTPGDPIVSGPDAPGTAATKNPVQVGGVDGNGNVQRAMVINSPTTGNEMGLVVRDADDNLQLNQLIKIGQTVASQILKVGPFGLPASLNNPLPVSVVQPPPGPVTAYTYHTSANFAASSTTDNFTMSGFAGGRVQINKITVSCTQTTAGITLMKITKHSVADTGGTSAAVTPTPDDSAYPPAKAAPLSYTSTGPTVAAGAVNVDEYYLGCLAAGTATPNDIYMLNLRNPIVLHGTAEQVAVNFNNGALTGGNINVTFETTELVP